MKSLREQKDAAAASNREAELKGRQEVAAHLGREKDLSYFRDLGAVVRNLEDKKQKIDAIGHQKCQNEKGSSLAHAEVSYERHSEAARRREEKERQRLDGLVEWRAKREERMMSSYSLA
jgi:hypothetical protein